MRNFWMKLHTINILSFIRNCRNHICFGVNFKTLWHYFYFVEMAHPNDRICRNAFKKFRSFINMKIGFSVFSFYTFFYFSAQNVSGQLHSVANSKNWNLRFEKRFFYQMSIFCIYRTWTSGKDNPNWFFV